MQVLGNPSRNPEFSCKGCKGHADKKTGLKAYSAAGELLREDSSNNGKWTIDDLKPGVYFAVLDSQRKKFVVVE